MPTTLVEENESGPPETSRPNEGGLGDPERPIIVGSRPLQTTINLKIPCATVPIAWTLGLGARGMLDMRELWKGKKGYEGLE
ncbi:hypothetical protein GX50_06003 [[Emmonsia] crescens]|uniref:Uncharacterized protein n=1 Tax=[Emmonsia] crescens TaxID=73230 RepID=A0A2B7ZDI1_9EURO|nr:hypothetical protein GX50_06003 [Emmonsia crescens]